jgi:hypothetical protein
MNLDIELRVFGRRKMCNIKYWNWIEYYEVTNKTDKS